MFRDSTDFQSIDGFWCHPSAMQSYGDDRSISGLGRWWKWFLLSQQGNQLRKMLFLLIYARLLNSESFNGIFQVILKLLNNPVLLDPGISAYSSLCCMYLSTTATMPSTTAILKRDILFIATATVPEKETWNFATHDAVSSRLRYAWEHATWCMFSLYTQSAIILVLMMALFHMPGRRDKNGCNSFTSVAGPGYTMKD